MVEVGGKYLNLTEYLMHRFDLYLLILFRVSGLFISAPIFSSRNLPTTIKIGLSACLALIIFPIIPAEGVMIDSLLTFATGIIGELAIGFMFGFVSSLIFAAIQTGGQLIDTQMGFAMVNVFDPQSGIQVPLIGNFKYLLALLIFLITNSHHYFLYAIINSFYKVPLLSFAYNQAIIHYLIQSFANSFLITIQIALPVFGTLFLAEVALGIIARTVPQMNVFIVGIPAKIALGITALYLALPLYVYFLKYIFEKMYDDIFILFSLM